MAENILIGLYDFLQPYLPIVNSHNVDYLIRNHWETYVPEWLKTMEPINLYDLYEHRYETSVPPINPLESFIDQLVEWRRRIEQLMFTKERFENEIFQDKERFRSKRFKYANRTFMSQKKEHEVDILAPIIDQVTHVVDAHAVRNQSIRHPHRLIFF